MATEPVLSSSSPPSVSGGGAGTPTNSSPLARLRHTMSRATRASAQSLPTLMKNCALRSSTGWPQISVPERAAHLIGNTSRRDNHGDGASPPWPPSGTDTAAWALRDRPCARETGTLGRSLYRVERFRCNATSARSVRGAAREPRPLTRNIWSPSLVEPPVSRRKRRRPANRSPESYFSADPSKRSRQLQNLGQHPGRRPVHG